ESADLVRRGRFVGGGVSEEASFPAEGGPFAVDAAVYFVGPGGGCPVDRATLEVVEPTNLVRGWRLVGEREPKERVHAAEPGVQVDDGAVHLERADVVAPVHATVLEPLHRGAGGGGHHFRRTRNAKHGVLGAKRSVLGADQALSDGPVRSREA